MTNRSSLWLWRCNNKPWVYCKVPPPNRNFFGTTSGLNIDPGYCGGNVPSRGGGRARGGLPLNVLPPEEKNGRSDAFRERENCLNKKGRVKKWGQGGWKKRDGVRKKRRKSCEAVKTVGTGEEWVVCALECGESSCASVCVREWVLSCSRLRPNI